MSLQYKRAYELTIIPPDGDATVIDKLRINFEITKSVLSTPNLARITLYGLSDKTLAKLERRYTKIILNAGYEGNLSLLFKGDVRNVYKSFDEVDSMVTIYSGDGEKDFQNATFNKTFSPNVPVSKVVDELIASFTNSAKGIVNNLPTGNTKLRGQTLSGSTKDILDTLAKEFNFDWSIQDNEVIVNGKNTALRSNEAVLISASTGMINSPTITEVGADVVTQFNAKLLPNFAFKIVSAGQSAQIPNIYTRTQSRTRAEGLYRVQEVTFRGDSRDGEWVSEVKGKRV